ncbi:hypothetical protein JQX13_50295 [Archangium violaceum]|nr:hypothetical protein JQX13_50295 [Archangium violaceum]
MGTFFTKRQLRLMGLPEPEETHTPPPPGPPRCCEKAVAEQCYCQSPGWKCPDHGVQMSPCRPNFSHD